MEDYKNWKLLNNCEKWIVLSSEVKERKKRREKDRENAKSVVDWAEEEYGESEERLEDEAVRNAEWEIEFYSEKEEDWEDVENELKRLDAETDREGDYWNTTMTLRRCVMDVEYAGDVVAERWEGKPERDDYMMALLESVKQAGEVITVVWEKAYEKYEAIKEANRAGLEILAKMIEALDYSGNSWEDLEAVRTR